MCLECTHLCGMHLHLTAWKDPHCMSGQLDAPQVSAGKSQLGWMDLRRGQWMLVNNVLLSRCSQASTAPAQLHSRPH